MCEKKTFSFFFEKKLRIVTFDKFVKALKTLYKAINVAKKLVLIWSWDWVRWNREGTGF